MMWDGKKSGGTTVLGIWNSKTELEFLNSLRGLGTEEE
jgi:hypothetical protein